MTAAEVLTSLRDKGVTVRADGDAVHLRPRSALTDDDIAAVSAVKDELVQLLVGGAGDHPIPDAAGPRHVADALPFLDMPLDVFKTDGALLEVSVPWLDVTLWFVPTKDDANVLLEEGVTRGRIWTSGELMDLMTAAPLTGETVRTIALAKIEFDGDVIVVRRRTSGSEEGRPR